MELKTSKSVLIEPEETQFQNEMLFKDRFHKTGKLHFLLYHKEKFAGDSVDSCWISLDKIVLVTHFRFNRKLSLFQQINTVALLNETSFLQS